MTVFGTCFPVSVSLPNNQTHSTASNVCILESASAEISTAPMPKPSQCYQPPCPLCLNRPRSSSSRRRDHRAYHSDSGIVLGKLAQHIHDMACLNNYLKYLSSHPQPAQLMTVVANVMRLSLLFVDLPTYYEAFDPVWVWQVGVLGFALGISLCTFEGTRRLASLVTHD